MLASGSAPSATAPTVAVTSSPSANTSVPTTAVSASGSVATSQAFAVSNLQGATVTLSDGTALNLPLAPTDIPNLLQTTGANGVTEMLANTMQQAADQLLAKGKITQSQHGLFTQLSNQGHAMAAIEQQIEAAVTTSQDYSQFVAQTQQTMIT